MPKARKKKVQQKGISQRKTKQSTKKVVQLSKKNQKTIPPAPVNRSLLIPTIIIIIIIVLLIALVVLATLIYYSSLSTPITLTVGDNVGEASYTGDSAKVRLSDDVNLNNVKTIELVFSDGETQYVYSALDVGQDYEITASDLGLDNFDSIVSVSASIRYNEPETPEEPAQAPSTQGTTTPRPSSSGGDTGGGGGGGGGGDDGGDDSCTDECASEGLFCDGNQPYNCSKAVGGCLEKTYLSACLQGEDCSGGRCVPAQCSANENCTTDGCYSGEYRDYYCNASTGYCDYHDISQIENSTNNNCNNSIDDDCDTLLDMNDSGCQGVGGCGNNILDAGEVCDNESLDSKTCSDFGYSEGILYCCPDCLNFNLFKCYNKTYGVCYDWDNGKIYDVASNATQAVGYDYGPDCPNVSAGGGGGGGGVGIVFDSCEGTILTEYFCNSSTNRIDSVQYDCALINKTCESGACVGAGTCGNRYCEGGSERLIHEGNTITTDFNGRSYDVKLAIVISNTLADIMVNNNTQRIEEGEIYTVENLPIDVLAITSGSLVNKTGNASLYLGENEQTCPQDCSPATCGNSLIEAGEVCDLTHLDNKTCQDFGYNEGNISCCADCINFDLSLCRNVTRTCMDHDGEDYYTASNLTAGSGSFNGPNCMGASGGGGGVYPPILDYCNGSVLIERICTDENRPSTVEFDCASVNMTCLDRACVGTIQLPSMSLVDNLRKLWDLLFGWI